MCMFSSQHFRLISHSQYPANQEDFFVVNFHSVPWLPTQYLFWSPLNSVSQSIHLQLVCMWWHCQTSLLVAMTSEQQNDKMLAGMLATKWSKNVLTDVHFMYFLLHLVNGNTSYTLMLALTLGVVLLKFWAIVTGELVYKLGRLCSED